MQATSRWPGTTRREASRCRSKSDARRRPADLFPFHHQLRLCTRARIRSTSSPVTVPRPRRCPFASGKRASHRRRKTRSGPARFPLRQDRRRQEPPFYPERTSTTPARPYRESRDSRASRSRPARGASYQRWFLFSRSRRRIRREGAGGAGGGKREAGSGAREAGRGKWERRNRRDLSIGGMANVVERQCDDSAGS